MKYELDGIIYDVVIIKKNNKNTYIRIKDNGIIQVTTGYFSTKSSIIKLLDNNKKSIRNMLNRQLARQNRDNLFFYLGKSYDIIEVSTIENVLVDDDKIFIPNQKKLDKWLKKEIIELFNERYEVIYNYFDEVLVKPTLKIRSMKSRWGVYNKQNHSITLNSKLIEYDIDKLDYVIIHELSHVIHFNHSKEFWNLVSKYCPEYKMRRKELKE
jgi:hypothetical protein